MKVIVTGSEGFIGRALVRRLKRGGIDVIRVDRREMCNRYCLREASEIGKILDPTLPPSPLDYRSVGSGLQEVVHKMFTGPESRPQF